MLYHTQVYNLVIVSLSVVLDIQTSSVLHEIMNSGVGRYLCQGGYVLLDVFLSVSRITQKLMTNFDDVYRRDVVYTTV